jgi:hypothetical protein
MVGLAIVGLAIVGLAIVGAAESSWAFLGVLAFVGWSKGVSEVAHW